MTAVLQAATCPWSRSTDRSRPARRQRANDEPLRPAGIAVMLGHCAVLAIGVARAAQDDPGFLLLPAVLATAAYVPLHLRHVAHASDGRISRVDLWTLAVMAAVILGLLPVLGVQWLGAFYGLAASALLVLRAPWSFLVVAGLVVTAVLTGQEWGFFYAFGILLYAAVFTVPVWLIATARELHAARAQAADEAVLRERLRIDRDLRDALGVALEAIAARGRTACERMRDDPDGAEPELAALVATAREGLATARRTVRRYRDGEPGAELTAAAALLRAAGVDARLAPVAGPVPAAAGPALAATLRAEVARLLRDEAVTRCVLTVTVRANRVALRIEADGTGPVVREVTSA